MTVKADCTIASLPSLVQREDGHRVGSIEEFVAWVEARRGEIVAQLHQHGALLFRGFPIGGAEGLQRIATVFCGTLSSYVGGNSPRTRVEGNVFTTTEYPASEKISLHNEGSYLPDMPRLVLFQCEVAPTDRGQTPLADSRRVYAAIDPAVRERFAARRNRYVTNLHDGGGGVGNSWPKVFQTNDRAEVERRLTSEGYDFEWTRDGGLRTSIVADAVRVHPETGEPVWISQAEQWHPSSLPARTRTALASFLAEREFPHYACYGDGTPFDDAELNHIRAVMAAEERLFEWQARDLVLCDNLLVMHGRQPFSGPRRILAALG
jgi:alpha-ketoglutarate-dependent taurine dioxygenase